MLTAEIGRSLLLRGQVAHTILQDGRDSRLPLTRNQPPRCPLAGDLVKARQNLHKSTPLRQEDASRYNTLLLWEQHEAAHTTIFVTHASLITNGHTRRKEVYQHARGRAIEHLVVNHEQLHRRKTHKYAKCA